MSTLASYLATVMTIQNHWPFGDNTAHASDVVGSNTLTNDADSSDATLESSLLNTVSTGATAMSGCEFEGTTIPLPGSGYRQIWFAFQSADGGGDNPILTNGNFETTGFSILYNDLEFQLLGPDGSTAITGSASTTIGQTTLHCVAFKSDGSGLYFEGATGGTGVSVGTFGAGTISAITGGNLVFGGDGEGDDTLGTYQEGYQGVSATAPTLSQFQTALTMVGLPASQLAWTGAPANRWANAPLITSGDGPLVVSIENSDGGVVPSSAAVTVTISSGTLNGTTTENAVNGVATFSNLSVPAAGSSFTLTAASSGLTSATTGNFSITAPTKLAWSQQPTSQFPNDPITPAPTVLVQNASGTTDPYYTGAVTVSIASGSGTLGGTLTVNAVAGVATFNDIYLATGSGSFTLSATSGSLTPATSSSFADLVPTKLGFPASIPLLGADPYAYQQDGSPISVLVQDSAGATVPTDTSTVTLSVASGPGTLKGQTSVAAVGGVATFNFLSFSAAGVYTLTASDGSLTSATTNSFFVQVTDNQLLLPTADGSWAIQPARALTFADPGTLCLLNHQSNSGSGTTAPDATGNNVVTYTGTPTLTTNPISPANYNAQALNGSSEDITIAETLNLAAQSTWSFSVLFSINGTLSGTQYLCRQNYSTGDLFEGIFDGDTGPLSFELLASGASQSGFGTIPAPQTFDGSGIFSWKNSGPHLYTLTWDEQYFRAYFDGQLVGTYLAVGNLTGSPSSGFCLGAYPTGSNWAPVTFYCTEFRKDVLSIEQHIQRWKQFKTPTRTAYTRLNQKLYSTLSSGQVITEEGTWDTRSSRGNYTLYATANNGSGTSVIQRFTSPDLKNWSAGTTVLGNGVGGIPGGVAVYRSRWKMFPGSSTVYFYFRRSDAPQNLYVAISSDGGNTYTAQSTPVVSSSGQQFDGCESSDVLPINGTYWMRLEADVAGWGGVSKGFILSCSTPNGTFAVANGGNPLNSLMQYPGAAFGCRPSMYQVGSKIFELGHFSDVANEFGPTAGALAVIDASAIGTDSYQLVHSRLAPLKQVDIWPLEAVQVADISLLAASNSDGTNDCILVCTGGTTYNETSLEFFVAKNCTLNQLFGVDNNPSPVSVSVNRQLGRARMVA
jgi:hypothetical protein